MTKNKVMKSNYPASSTSLLVALVLILSTLLSGIPVSHADQGERAVVPAQHERSPYAARKSKKLSPDLEVAAARLDADDAPVRTIVQVRDPQSENLKQLLKRHGIRVHRMMNNLQMMDVELSKAALNELA